MHEPEIDASDPIAPHSLSPRELKTLLAAEREGRPLLVLRDGESELRLHTLEQEGGQVTIGRRSAAAVSLPWDREVSGLHAELECSAGEWLIVDDGLSMNGTFVNGERVAGRQRLRDGDRVRVGRTTIAFVDVTSPATQPTAAASSESPGPHVNEAQRRVLVALCRPYVDGDRFAVPPSNQQIAEEVFLSVETVKMHLRALFAGFGLGELPRNEKRARLAAEALRLGLVSRRDLV